MTLWSIVGIAVAFLVDFALPATLLAVMIRSNFRGRPSDSNERNFWIGMACYVIFVGFFIALALRGTFNYEGYTTLMAVFFALPMSAVPAIFNSNIIHFFFTDPEWLEYGYFFVMTIFLVGLIPWVLLLPAWVRWGTQRSALRYAAQTTHSSDPSVEGTS